MAAINERRLKLLTRAVRPLATPYTAAQRTPPTTRTPSQRFSICQLSTISRTRENHMQLSSRQITPMIAATHFSSKYLDCPRRRLSSTNTTSTPSGTGVGARAAAAVNAATRTPEILTWNEFLRLRKIRRRFNLAASTGLAAVTFVGGLGWLSEQNLEQLASQLFGLDPFLVMGMCALGFAGAGWIVGPFLGSAVWRASYSSRVRGMAIKERDFFERIRKYRVDPTTSSVQNPVPDYYGEKITSVQGYRRWLKDQRAFNKKRQVAA